MARVIHVNTVIANHLVINGYGHWLPNDPRGSGSNEVRQEKFQNLGPIHPGRRMRQPSKEQLKAFYIEAEPLLEFPRIWFDRQTRIAVARAFAQVAKQQGYTCWACAVLRNHAHLLVRVHRDRAELMWEQMAIGAREALRAAGLAPQDHPVWSNRPYVVFKRSVREVESAIEYIRGNPKKHGLAPQVHEWVFPCDGWPHRR